MARITIIGPGAVGGTIAGWLGQDDAHEVTVAARTPFAELGIETLAGMIRATPRVILSPADASEVDWTLVATKAYDAESASRWFPKMVGARTRVAILQNGVEHVERFSPYLSIDQILPVMVDLPATRTAPGKIIARGHQILVVPNGEMGQAFCDLFTHTKMKVTQTDDFKTVVWRKLCANSAGAMSAVLLKPSRVAKHPGIKEMVRQIVLECVAVGRAEGAILEDSIANEIADQHHNATGNAYNSLYADRAAGRTMEIDARNGVIVRLGKKHGIPTPTNAMVVTLLEGIEQCVVS